MYKNTAMIVTGLFFLTACASNPKPEGGESTGTKSDTPLNVADLTFDQTCSVSLRNSNYQPQEGDNFGAIFTALGSALITQGVDFVGERLKSASEEKTRTSSAIVNVTSNQKESCLKLSRGSDFEFEIVLKQVPGRPAFVEPQLTSYNYKTSIDGKTRGERGLTLTVDISRPGSATTASQTVNLGNVELGTLNKKFIKKLPLMANPFIRAKTKDDTAKYPNGYPFTINMTLTEVRNANALLKFTSDSFGQANDDITSVILNELGFPNVEDDSASQAISNWRNLIMKKRKGFRVD